jgi:cysteinyl-tRNA synthetase
MESASGQVPFVGYWLHTGFLTVDGQKMSKSLHNFHTIREVIEQGYDPMAIRLMMLQTHYRAPLNFTLGNLDAAANRLRHWRNVAALRHQTHDTLRDDDEKSTDDDSVSLYAASQALVEVLGDDLNTADAFKLIDEAFDRINGATLKDIHQHALVGFLETIDDLLGLRLLNTTPDIEDAVKQLVLERERARESKDFKNADRLRIELADHGIAVRDTPSGPIWEYVA